MQELFFTMLPTLVCLFWSITLTTDFIVNKLNPGAFPQRQWMRPKQYLLLFMLVTASLYFGHYAYFNHLIGIIPYAGVLYRVANLAVYPLYYLYICSLTMRSTDNRRWAILLPSVIAGVTSAVLYTLMTQEEKSMLIDRYIYGGDTTDLYGLALWYSYFVVLCKVVFGLYIIPILYMGFKRLRDYERFLLTAYSDVENRTLVSLHYMLLAFVVTSVLSFVANVMGRSLFADTEVLLPVISTVFSILLYLIGYTGYHTSFCMHDIELDELRADSESTTNENTVELRARIERLMADEQLYLRADLKIIDLVNLLGTNRNYIYQAINRDMGISFSEYVNRMRIAHARELIDTLAYSTTSEVAQQSGFSSSASFYRNFRQYVGVSPKEYMLRARIAQADTTEGENTPPTTIQIT